MLRKLAVGVVVALGLAVATPASGAEVTATSPEVAPLPCDPGQPTLEQCDVPILVTVVPPTYTPPTCDAPGTLVGIDTEYYLWIRTGPDSAAFIQAVAFTAGANLTGQTGWGPYDLRQLTGAACGPVDSFVDVPATSPFYDAIMWLVDQAITAGYADGTFRPTLPISRQAMAAFVYRMVNDGADAPACTAKPFTDVDIADPFCGEIAWLKTEGLTEGYPGGTYRPTSGMSRQAMAAFIYRMVNDGADAPACTAKPFTDVAVADAFCGEITWLKAEGLTDGYPDGTYRPAVAMSRQAMAAFLFRANDAGLFASR